MIALLAFALLAVTPRVAAQPDAFQRALELTAEGKFRAALRTVDDETLDPISRAQARVWVYDRAGLLDIARAEVERALSVAPDDPWLLARATELDLALHDPRSAAAHFSRLQEVGTARSEDPSQLADQVAAALALEETQSVRLQGARIVTLGLISVCLGWFAALLRGSRRNSQVAAAESHAA